MAKTKSKTAEKSNPNPNTNSNPNSNPNPKPKPKTKNSDTVVFIIKACVKQGRSFAPNRFYEVDTDLADEMIKQGLAEETNKEVLGKMPPRFRETTGIDKLLGS